MILGSIAIGTVMIMLGACCIVFGVIWWIVFIVSTRKKNKRRLKLLVDEYSCMNGENDEFSNK